MHVNKHYFYLRQPPPICSSSGKHPSVGLMVGCCCRWCSGLAEWRTSSPPMTTLQYDSGNEVNFSGNGSTVQATVIHGQNPRARAHPSHDKPGWEGGKTIPPGNFRFTHNWPFREAPTPSRCLHCKKWERGHLNEMNSDNQEEEIDYYYQMALQRDYRPRLPITAQPQLPRPETGWFPSLKYDNRPDVRCKEKWVVFEVTEVSEIQ